MRRTLPLLAAALWLAGCLGDRVTSVDITPDETPQVHALVHAFDAGTGRPLPDARYRFLSPTREGGVDSLGYAEVGGLYAGDLAVIGTAPDHLPTLLARHVDAAEAGVTVVLPLALVPLGGRAVVTVVPLDGKGGLAGVPVSIAGVRHPELGEGAEVMLDGRWEDGVTGDDGRLVLENLPRAEILFHVPGWDADGDGRPDYSPAARWVDLSQVAQDSILLTLPPAPPELPVVVATNLGSDYSDLEGPILVAFDPVPVPDSLYVDVNRQVRLEWRDANRLALFPTGPLNRAWTRIRIYYRQPGDDALLLGRTFYWTAFGTVPPGDCGELVADLRFDGLDETIDSNTTEIPLAWEAVSCTDRYQLYARHEDAETWQLVAEVPSDFGYGSVHTLVDVGALFDRFPSDGLVTPFAGPGIRFCAVPAGAENPLPGPPHPTLLLRDNVPPTWGERIGAVLGPPADDGAVPFYLMIAFSEYLAQEPEPTLALRRPGEEQPLSLALQWTWLLGGRGGIFSATVAGDLPDSLDAFLEGSATDLAGNPITVGAEAGLRMPVIQFNTSFEGEDGPLHPTGELWERGVPALPGVTPVSGQECWAVSLDGTWPAGVYADLETPWFMVPFGRPRFSFFCLRRLSGDTVKLYVEDEEGRHEILHWGSWDDADWTRYEVDLSGWSGRAIRLSWQFHSYGSADDNGYFIDDMSFIW